MKLFFLIIMTIFASCSSQQAKISDIAEKTCSSESYQYLEQNLELVKSKKLKVEQGGPILKRLSPEINKCMLAEALRTERTERMHFCVVVGFDKFGQQEYFEISSKISLHTPELNECLNNLKHHKEFQGLQSAIIYTPLEFIF